MREPTEDKRALGRYLKEIGAFPRLSLEDERLLVSAIEQGKPGALDRLVQSNLGFVVKVAMEYRSLGLPVEDLINEGNLGLIEAAGRFDATRGTKFTTYAIWWIRKMILRALSEKALVVRIPTTHSKQMREIRKAQRQLTQNLGREPTRTELSKRVGLRERTVDRILRTRRKTVSLDWPKLEHDERSLADLVASFGVSTEQLLVDRETRKAVFVAFRSLSPQQQTVLVLRFGLGGHRPLTLREIGLQIERSRERVRQIENQAKQHIRTQLAKRTRSPAKRSETSLSH